MGDLYSGHVDRAVLKLSSNDSLSSEARRFGLMSLLTIKTINDRTLTLAATRVARQDFHNEVERWDPVSAISFVDMTNAQVKIKVLKSIWILMVKKMVCHLLIIKPGYVQ